MEREYQGMTIGEAIERMGILWWACVVFLISASFRQCCDASKILKERDAIAEKGAADDAD